MIFYHASDVLDFASFIQTPKYLFDEPYQDMTNNAKMLYILMLDRLSLSIKNNWTKDSDDIYILYDREVMMQDLNIGSKSTISKAINELVTHQLIHIVRQGKSKANRIYICKI